jgi:hypothetical protein
MDDRETLSRRASGLFELAAEMIGESLSIACKCPLRLKGALIADVQA